MSSSVCTQRLDATLLRTLVTFPQPRHLPSSRPHTAARSFAHHVQLSTFYCPARRVHKLRALLFSASYSVGSTYVSRLTGSSRATTLLRVSSDAARGAGHLISPALVPYVFMKANSRVTSIRIKRLMGSPSCQLNLKRTIACIQTKETSAEDVR